MSQYFQRPENALRRAEELVQVDKIEDAMATLHTALSHRRFKQNWTTTMEKIIMRHGELCVPVRKLKLLKEGLYQYRAICQQANIGSLQTVIEHIRDLAEQEVAKVKQVVEDQEKEADLAKIDDLDEMESPDDILLQAVQADVKRDVDRDVHAWLRFLWEVYKTILDLLKNNARLEDCYHETARRAFDFCAENQRQHEFKRLSETLRNHSANQNKAQYHDNHVSLNNPETVQRMLETRFKQLDVSVKCGLWREAHMTIDDIFALMQKRRPKPQMLSQYYAGLAKIFWKGNNQIFHAYALMKYFTLCNGQHKAWTRDPKLAESAANQVVLAVLSIPLNRYTAKNKSLDIEVDHVKERNRRFAALLKSATIPTRETLRSDLVAKHVVELASPAVQRLYQLMEEEFTPLSLCADSKPHLEEVMQDDFFEGELQQYGEPLRKVIFVRFAGQLSRVYSSVTMDSFLEMSCIVSASEAEKWLVQASNRTSPDFGSVHAKIDHQNRGIHFSSGDFHSKALRSQLSTLGIALTMAVQKLYPEAAARDEEEWKNELFTDVANRLEADHAAVFKRKRLIERRKEQNEKLEQQKDAEAREKADLEEKDRQRREKDRMAQEKIRRDQERADKAKRDEEIKASMAVLEQIKAQQASKKDGEDKVGIKVMGKRIEELDANDLSNLNKDQLEKAREHALKQEKSQKVREFKKAFKANDHLARALREEENSRIPAWSKEMKQTDEKCFADVQVHALEKAKTEHASKLADKKRLMEFAPLINDFREKLLVDRRKQYERALETWEMDRTDFLVQEKLNRARDRWQHELDREERERREAEEEERRIQEEEERREQEAIRAQEREEEEARRAEDRERRMEERKREREEADARLAKQLEREREIEERRAREDADRRAGRNRDDDRRREEPASRADGADAWRRADPLPKKEDSRPNWRGGGDRDRDRPNGDRMPAPKSRAEEDSGPWRRDAPARDDAPPPRGILRRGDTKPTDDDGPWRRKTEDKKEDGPAAWRPRPREERAAPKEDGDGWRRPAAPEKSRDEPESGWRRGGDDKPAEGGAWRPRERSDRPERAPKKEEGGGDVWRRSDSKKEEGGDGWRSSAPRGGRDRDAGKGDRKGGKGERRGDDRGPRRNSPRRDRGEGGAWRQPAANGDSNPQKDHKPAWGSAQADKQNGGPTPDTSANNENMTGNGTAAPMDDDGFQTAVNRRRRR